MHADIIEENNPAHTIYSCTHMATMGVKGLA